MRIRARAGVETPEAAGAGPLWRYVDRLEGGVLYDWSQGEGGAEASVWLDVQAPGRRAARVLTATGPRLGLPRLRGGAAAA